MSINKKISNKNYGFIKYVKTLKGLLVSKFSNFMCK